MKKRVVHPYRFGFLQVPYRYSIKQPEGGKKTKYLIQDGFSSGTQIWGTVPSNKMFGKTRHHTLLEYPTAFNEYTICHSLPDIRTSALR